MCPAQLLTPTTDTSLGSPLLFSLATLISDFSFQKIFPFRTPACASCEGVFPQFPSLSDPGEYRAAPSVEKPHSHDSQGQSWRLWSPTGQRREEAPAQSWGSEPALPELSGTEELDTELSDRTS